MVSFTFTENVHDKLDNSVNFDSQDLSMDSIMKNEDSGSDYDELIYDSNDSLESEWKRAQIKTINKPRKGEKMCKLKIIAWDVETLNQIKINKKVLH